uniref:Podocalyxin n=1 Tax=Callorhinchus milii TaxID=7868 RepID=A0A4W3IG56_CALMI
MATSQHQSLGTNPFGREGMRRLVVLCFVGYWFIITGVSVTYTTPANSTTNTRNSTTTTEMIANSSMSPTSTPILTPTTSQKQDQSNKTDPQLPTVPTNTTPNSQDNNTQNCTESKDGKENTMSTPKMSTPAGNASANETTTQSAVNSSAANNSGSTLMATSAPSLTSSTTVNSTNLTVPSNTSATSKPFLVSSTTVASINSTVPSNTSTPTDQSFTSSTPVGSTNHTVPSNRSATSEPFFMSSTINTAGPSNGSTNSSSVPGTLNGTVSDSETLPTQNTIDMTDSPVHHSKASSQESNVSSPSPSTPSLMSHADTPTKERPGENNTASSAGTFATVTSSVQNQNQMKCVKESSEYISILFLNESTRCESFVRDKGDQLAKLLCRELRKKYASTSYCEVYISPNSANQKLLKIVDVVFKVNKEEISQSVEHLRSQLGMMNSSINTVLDTSSADALQTKKTVALSVTGILLLLICTFGTIYMCCQYRTKQTKPQYPNEESQTRDNGCHDNPALDISETQAEMQEKKGKLKNSFLVLTEGFGEETDSWITPLHNSKDELEGEEDTHL